MIACVRTLFSHFGCAVQVPHESEVFNILGMHHPKGIGAPKVFTLEFIMIVVVSGAAIAGVFYKTGFVTAIADMTGLQ